MASSSAPGLLAIPPEILLTIISHLPTSKAFLPLVQTCRGFKAFFSTNAAIICNTHIVKYHSFATSMLNSTFVLGEDGQSWLVPMHSMVLPDHHATFAGIQQPAYANNLPSPGFGSSAEMVCATDTKLDLGEKMLLGVPGAMYLSFLETMGWDLRIRLVMFRNSSRYGLHLDEARLSMRDDALETFAEEARQIEYFEWTVKQYVTRMFESRCRRFLNDFMIQTTEGRKCGVAMKAFQGLCDKWGLLKCDLVNILGRKHDIEETRGLLFGEIEKAEEETSKNDSERGEFARCLLWYYGRSGVLEFRRQEAYQVQRPSRPRKYACGMKAAIAKVNNIVARASMRKWLRETSTSVRNALRRWRRGGGVQILG